MALACFRLRDGAITDARLGVGGAESRPRRIAEAEAALNGRAPSPDVFEAAATAAAAAIDPLEDINTSAEYRRDLVRAMTRRALERAAA
jgi:carbon-monoxide dehydrogenase medium subunit